MNDIPPALALIQPLLDDGKRPLGQRFRSFLWLVRELARETPRPFSIWLVISIVQGCMPPFQLWASGTLVHSVEVEIAGGEAEPWLWMAAMAAALAGVRVLQPLRNWAEACIQVRGIRAIEGRVYTQATEVDLELLEYQQFYDVTKRIAQQSNTSLQEMVRAATAFFTNGIPLVGAVVIVAAIDWRLMLVLMLPLLPILFESLRQGGTLYNALREQTHDRRIAQYIADRFSDRQSAREIRLFGLADELISRWQHHYMHTRKDMRGKTTRAFLRMQLTGTWADLIIYGGLIWLITGGMVHTNAAEITVLMGAFMTTGNQASGLQEAMMNIGNHGGYAQDVRGFLDLPRTWASLPEQSTWAAPGALVLQNVRFAYPGSEINVIDGISFTIPEGQTLAIVGENGAGKTTLLKLMLGLYRPDSGSITLGGRDLQDIPVAERQALMAAVFQTFGKYPESFIDNITMPLPADEAQLERVVSDAGLASVIVDAPQGIHTVLSPDLGGVDLSGGQWQRLAIARAGYKDAHILALDEPTAALDPLAEVDVFRRFARLSANRSTILISHRLGMARLADRIVVIEHGKVTEDGTHQELVRKSGHYADLWEMQSRWYQ